MWIPQILRLLTGRESGRLPIVKQLVCLYVEKLQFHLEDALWVACSKELPLAADAMAAYNHLDRSAKYSVLLAPVVFASISKASSGLSGEHLTRLTELILGEHLLNSRIVTAGQEQWSLLGDFALIATTEGVRVEKQRKVLRSITVDFESIWCREEVAGGFDCTHLPYEAVSDKKKADIMNKVVSALNKVDAFAPVFGLLIRKYIRTIMVRTCSSVSAGFGSESRSDRIGCVHLLNVDRGEYTTQQLAEDLVHETVHSFLSMYEYAVRPFTNSEGDRGPRITSLWSGQSLAARAFCQAVFVYYTLYHFHLCVLETSADDADIAFSAKRREYCVSGFASNANLGEYVSECASVQNWLRPWLRRAQSIIV